MENGNKRMAWTEKQNITVKSYLSLLILFFISQSLPAQKDIADMRWKQVVYGQPDDWYGSEEAIRIAENVLLYQLNIGGWPKNTPMHNVLSKREKKVLKKLQPTNKGATTDNGATVMELTYLSKVYKCTGNSAYKAAFLRGIDYLIEAQYPNGGWPQFYPMRKGYYTHITFNDESMVNIMRVMKAISQKSDVYSIVADDKTVLKAKQAFEKGIKVILESQYKQNGVLTSWCAQHDEKTLEPAKARAYELPSLSGSESAGIVLLLMEIENPSPEIVNAVQSAVRWFEKVKIQGIRVESSKTKDGSMERRVVTDENAPPLWARFYELEDNRPFFCDRDGIKKYSMAEIGPERRNGYGWYSDNPQKVLDVYVNWQSKWGGTQYDIRREDMQEALQSKESMLAYRDACRRRYLNILGQFPEKTPLNPQVTKINQNKDYRIENVLFESLPNHHVAANYYVPNGEGPFPAALIFCGHEMTSKATESYQRTAILFAKNGFAALVVDPISQGEMVQFTDKLRSDYVFNWQLL